MHYPAGTGVTSSSPDQCSVNEPPPETSPANLREVQLVARCLKGDPQGWEEIYHLCHPRLLEAIAYLLGRNGRDASLVDEIAARVWYALLRDNGRLLARYDAQRNCRLGVFFVGLARNELMRYLRSEQRRRAREMNSGRRLFASQPFSERQLRLMVGEFAATLTPGERDFLEQFLLSIDNGEATDAEGRPSRFSVWQRRHRIRRKLWAFLGG